MQSLARRSMLQLAAPVESVRQHVTAPGLPHVEFDAHSMTVSAQSLGSVPALIAAFVARATHDT